MSPLNHEIRWDAYDNEEIIVYDDVTPALNELIYMSNVYFVDT